MRRKLIFALNVVSRHLPARYRYPAMSTGNHFHQKKEGAAEWKKNASSKKVGEREGFWQNWHLVEVEAGQSCGGPGGKTPSLRIIQTKTVPTFFNTFVLIYHLLLVENIEEVLHKSSLLNITEWNIGKVCSFTNSGGSGYYVSHKKVLPFAFFLGSTRFWEKSY